MSFHKLLPAFLCLLIIFAATPSVLGTELSIVANADSYTDSANPDANHGGSEIIACFNYESEYSDIKYHIWLKFNLSEIPTEATVNWIILRMHIGTISPLTTNRIGMFLCSNTDWQEMTITWNNSPAVTGGPVDTVDVVSADKDYDFNVTSAVKGRNIVTLVLETLEPTDIVGSANFYSRENYATEHRPRLIVVYTIPSQPWTTGALPFLTVGLVAIAVVILVVYVVTKKKKQQPPSTAPKNLPSTPSAAHLNLVICGSPQSCLLSHFSR